MAAIDDLPQRMLRHGAYLRAHVVMRALASMRQGGTAADVRDAVIDLTGDRHSVDAVKLSLWHLSELEKVQIELVENSRWYVALP